MITNGDGDTGRFKFLCDAEHDDPDQAPTYRQQRLVWTPSVWLTQETADALEVEET